MKNAKTTLASGMLWYKDPPQKDWSEEIAENEGQTSTNVENMKDWNGKDRLIRSNRRLIGVYKE